VTSAQAHPASPVIEASVAVRLSMLRGGHSAELAMRNEGAQLLHSDRRKALSNSTATAESVPDAQSRTLLHPPASCSEHASPSPIPRDMQRQERRETIVRWLEQVPQTLTREEAAAQVGMTASDLVQLIGDDNARRLLMWAPGPRQPIYTDEGILQALRDVAAQLGGRRPKAPIRTLVRSCGAGYTWQPPRGSKSMRM
jgi:hypothetical protein